MAQGHRVLDINRNRLGFNGQILCSRRILQRLITIVISKIRQRKTFTVNCSFHTRVILRLRYSYSDHTWSWWDTHQQHYNHAVTLGNVRRLLNLNKFSCRKRSCKCSYANISSFPLTQKWVTESQLGLGRSSITSRDSKRFRVYDGSREDGSGLGRDEAAKLLTALQKQPCIGSEYGEVRFTLGPMHRASAHTKYNLVK